MKKRTPRYRIEFSTTNGSVEVENFWTLPRATNRMYSLTRLMANPSVKGFVTSIIFVDTKAKLKRNTTT